MHWLGLGAAGAERVKKGKARRRRAAKFGRFAFPGSGLESKSSGLGIFAAVGEKCDCPHKALSAFLVYSL
eukprot:scaffold917_cov31-Phaeocystis_antarctica.AAC.1